MSQLETKIEKLEEGFRVHKLEDAARFDKATLVQENLIKSVENLTDEMRFWRQDQVKTNSLVTQTNANIFELKEIFDEDTIKNLKVLSGEEVTRNLKAISGWVSAAPYGKYLLFGLLGVIILVAQAFGALKSVGYFFTGK